MTDIALNPVTHDILVENNDIRLTNSLSEATTQRLKIRLQFFLEEWFLNREFGIPYFQQIFQKSLSDEEVDLIFKETISSTPGVERLVSFESDFNHSTRILSLKFKVLLTDGAEKIINIEL